VLKCDVQQEGLLSKMEREAVRDQRDLVYTAAAEEREDNRWGGEYRRRERTSETTEDGGACREEEYCGVLAFKPLYMVYHLYQNGIGVRGHDTLQPLQRLQVSGLIIE
jgi:hypothetical protein